MLEEVMLRFLEKAQMKGRAQLLEERTGISERRWRDGLGGLRPSTLDRAEKSADNYLRQCLEGSELTEEQRRTWIDDHPMTICASIIYEAEVPGDEAYPRTRSLASEIDKFGEDLRRARVEGGLDEAKALLRGTDWLGRRYFTKGMEEKAGGGPVAAWDVIEGANEWEDLALPLKAVTANCLFSLLAIWDVEYSSRFLPWLQPFPTFLLLQPYVVRGAEGQLEKKRDMFHLPVRRLLDLMGALGSYAERKQWPERSDVLGIVKDRSGVDERTLVKWRIGQKRFSLKHFAYLWTKVVGPRDGAVSDRIPPAIPVYAAATIFQDLFVRFGKGRRLESVCMHTEEYRYWWHAHRLEMSQARGTADGDVPWPDWLVKP